jgi:hypothetical protein
MQLRLLKAARSPINLFLLIPNLPEMTIVKWMHAVAVMDMGMEVIMEETPEETMGVDATEDPMDLVPLLRGPLCQPMTCCP